MKPLLPWANSREKELATILALIPDDIDTFVDPMVGDGAVYMNVNANNYVIADKVRALIDLYQIVQKPSMRYLTLLEQFSNSMRNIEPAMEVLLPRLLTIKDNWEVGMYGDWQNLVSAVGRVAQDIPYDDVFGSRFTDPEIFVQEIRHQLLAVIDGEDKIEDEGQFKNQLIASSQKAIYEYFVSIINNPDTKKTRTAALLLFLMHYAQDHRYIEEVKDGTFVSNYAPADAAFQIPSYKWLMGHKVREKMDRTTSYCQDVIRTLGFAKFQKYDFLFLDIPRTMEKGRQLRLFSEETSIKLADAVSKVNTRWFAIIRNSEPLLERYVKMGRNTCELKTKETIVWNY